jgi:hypothetical protein
MVKAKPGVAVENSPIRYNDTQGFKKAETREISNFTVKGQALLTQGFNVFLPALKQGLADRRICNHVAVSE